MSDNSIHVALAFTDKKGTYARHAAVTMASIFENTDSPVYIHILHDDTLTVSNQNAFKSLTSAYKQQIAFHNVSLSIRESDIDLQKLGQRSQLTVGTLFRLLLPQILDCNKVIYLDCDVVVTLDIIELWNVPIGDRAVAAVRDVWSLDYLDGKPISWRLGKVWNLMGIAHDSYFNAGVLLLNLEKIRSKYDFLKEFGLFLTKYGKCVTMEDQDFLNWLFSHDKLLIDEKFDHIRMNRITSDNVTGSIWHMASGSAKPWTLYSRPLVDDLYWKYLRKTPYCTSDEELLHIVLTDLSKSPNMHRHSSECARRVLKQLGDNIFRAHIWTVPYILYKSFLNKRPN